MADFERAFAKTMGHEGGYVYDPDDAGGETYKGISRRFHPLWRGWEIIERIKKLNEGRNGFKTKLDINHDLQKQVKEFYREHYWDRFQGDLIPSQEIADELFDTSVNMGTHRAVIFLQQALNLLNRNQKNYPDIIEDGGFGPQTLKTFEIYLKLENNDHSSLLIIINTLQGMHYVKYMRDHPEQEKYARGWFKRVTES
ncbi:hypothetical protein ES705_44560 [subsurface metagenome]